jgi:hypothetical protein
MYNLNYTYLTQLEVDTRQTFADISDDLILLNHGGSLEKTNAKTMISSWQDFFWRAPVEQKKNLNVIFTDLSVDHSLYVGTYQGQAYNYLDDNEMITKKELDDFFRYMDTASGGHSGRWCGKWNFNDMVRELSCAINQLHTRMADDLNIYPIGSIVVTNNNPASGDGFGNWDEKNSSYIAENVKAVSEISMGFNSGKVDGSSVGSNLSNVVVKPTKKSNSAVPTHEHKLTFQPESGSGGEDVAETEQGQFPTVGNIRAGINFVANSNGAGYSGRTNDTQYNKTGLVVATSHKDKRKGGGDAAPDFSVSYASKDPELSKINVAPTTFPINAKIWERRS